MEEATLSARFREALDYAAVIHASQRRKVSGTPYVAHLLQVAGIVLEHQGTEDEAIAALLHDAIEDQGGQRQRDDIRRRFGNPVVDIVDGCTDTDRRPKPPWRERKEAFLRSLGEASASIRLVTAADKLDNVRSLTTSFRQLGPAMWTHFNGGRDGTLWYHRAVVETLNRNDARMLIAELDRAVARLEELVDDPTKSA